jgi:hypothetical protein
MQGVEGLTRSLRWLSRGWGAGESVGVGAQTPSSAILPTMGRLARLTALVCLAGVAVVASTAPSLAATCNTAPSKEPDASGNFPQVTTCTFIMPQQTGINFAADEWLDLANQIPKGSTVIISPAQGPTQPAQVIYYLPPGSGIYHDYMIPKGAPIVSALISITDPFAPGPGGQKNPFNADFTCTDGQQLIAPVTSGNQEFFTITVPAPTGSLDTYCYVGYDDVDAGWNIQIQYVNGPLLPKWKDDLRKQRLAQTSHNTGVAAIPIGLIALVPGVGEGVAAGATVISAILSAIGVFTGDAAIDPVDSNFTVVVTPVPPNVDVSSYGPATGQLIQNLEQVMALSAAIVTTQNRATGALYVSDTNSQQLQVNALAGFESQLDVLLNQLPAQLAAYGQELLSQGVDVSTITLAQITALQQSLFANGLPSNLQSAATTLGIDTTTQQQMGALLASADTGQAESLLLSRFNSGPLAPPVLSGSSNVPIIAAVLPASRSAVVGSPVTAFATIINTGTSTATGCETAADPTLPLPINFSYQTTNPATNALTGTLNTPVNIPAGAAQSFVIVETPTATFPTVFSNLLFFCANANAAPQTNGLDTLLVSASTTAAPDVVALAASGDPGIVDIPGATGTGDFAVATVNVGASASITASANTSAATLPVSLAICQTDPTSGTCLAAPAASVTTTINSGQTPTFGIFVTGSGSVPFDPANNRVIVLFVDSNGQLRGATSVAVRTQ